MRWMAVQGYEGFYEVSESGDVRSVDRIIHHTGDSRVRNLKGKPLKAAPGSDGHLMVTLSREGVVKTHYIHKLVASNFVPGQVAGYEVCHNNGNERDNHYQNLRWDTRSENQFDRVRHGRNPRAGEAAVKAAQDRWDAKKREKEIIS